MAAAPSLSPAAIGAEAKPAPAPIHLQLPEARQPQGGTRGCSGSSLNQEKEAKALGTITLTKLAALHANSTWHVGFEAQLHKQSHQRFLTC